MTKNGESIKALLAYHDNLFFNLQDPEITNSAYDRLKATLKQDEMLFDDLVAESYYYPRLSPQRQIQLKKIYQKVTAIIMKQQSKNDNWLIFAGESMFNTEEHFDDMIAIKNTVTNHELLIATTYLEMSENCYQLSNEDLNIICEIKQLLSPTKK